MTCWTSCSVRAYYSRSLFQRSHHILLGLFWETLPLFTAVVDFEWIGYPELQVKDVETILHSHSKLESLGLVYVIRFLQPFRC